MYEITVQVKLISDAETRGEAIVAARKWEGCSLTFSSNTGCLEWDCRKKILSARKIKNGR